MEQTETAIGPRTKPVKAAKRRKERRPRASRGCQAGNILVPSRRRRPLNPQAERRYPFGHQFVYLLELVAVYFDQQQTNVDENPRPISHAYSSRRSHSCRCASGKPSPFHPARLSALGPATERQTGGISRTQMPCP